MQSNRKIHPLLSPGLFKHIDIEDYDSEYDEAFTPQALSVELSSSSHLTSILSVTEPAPGMMKNSASLNKSYNAYNENIVLCHGLLFKKVAIYHDYFEGDWHAQRQNDKIHGKSCPIHPRTLTVAQQERTPSPLTILELLKQGSPEPVDSASSAAASPPRR